MKNASYANRGLSFEELIKRQNGYYRRHGLGMVEKQNTKFLPIRDRFGKIVTCKVDEKATVDFIGHYKGIPVAFDAKECAKDAVSLAALQPHQADYLEDWTRGGNGIGFVAVCFGFEVGYIVPWIFWREALKARRDGIKNHTFTAMGINWMLTGKASIRRDEMAPEWKVDIGGRGGFEYMQTILRLWGYEEVQQFEKA